MALATQATCSGAPPRFTRPFDVPASLDTAARLALLGEVIADGCAAPAVRVFARKVYADACAVSAQHRALPFGTALAVAALVRVQGLPFAPDPPGRDVYQPLAVTVERGGDCEDLVALYVGVLRAVVAMHPHAEGVEARAAWFEVPGAEEDHVVAVVRESSAAPWRWAECSVVGAWLGEHPRDAVRRLSHPRGFLLALGEHAKGVR